MIDIVLFLLLIIKIDVVDILFELDKFVEKHSKSIGKKWVFPLIAYGLIHSGISAVIYLCFLRLGQLKLFLLVELFLIIILEKIRTSTVLLSYADKWHNVNSKQYKMAKIVKSTLLYILYWYIVFK